MENMKKVSALIFGYNEYSMEIAKNVIHKYENIILFSSNQDAFKINSEFIVETFDLSDNWDDLEEKYDMKNSIAFCVLNSEAENVFLTISLRSYFKDLSIVAIAKSKEDANKLNMAGANKVVPLVETTAGIITDMIEKPIVTKVLHKILFEEGNLKIAQIKVENQDYFEGKYPSDIDWSRYRGIIVLSVIDKNSDTAFIYSSKIKHHIIKNGDIFVVVGYETDIIEFEKMIGSRCDVDWGSRSR